MLLGGDQTRNRVRLPIEVWILYNAVYFRDYFPESEFSYLLGGFANLIILMKYASLFALFLGLAGVSGAQDGISFAASSWEEARDQARAEDKIVFLDAYATWCGPCRKMKEEVFSERAVGDYFNEHFISIRLDMEEGPGLELARKYEVSAFPTQLFLSPDGKVMHRAIGFHNAPELIQLGRIANDPERRYASFTTRYASGERDPEFMYAYAMASFLAMSGNRERIARAYLETQTDWSTERNLRLIFNLVDDSRSEWFEYLVHHRQSFEELFGVQAVLDRVQGIIFSEAFADDAGEDVLGRVQGLLEKSYPEIAGQLFGLFKINYFQYKGEHEAFARAAVDYYRSFPVQDAAELNNVAWTFYDSVDDPELLETALAWSLKSVELDPGYYNYDTLAGLYFKLGKKRKARKAAHTAIELARSEGVDYSSTQTLLDQIGKW